MGYRHTNDNLRRAYEEFNQVTSMLGGLCPLGDRLETIRLEGNAAFAHQNWSEALRAYSTCIAMGGGGHLEVTGRYTEDYNRVMKLAYSNRAETRLRLREFEFALEDANEALQIDPKHVKTLVRKGKAALGLALYEMACETSKLALKESPQELSIVELLKESSIAHQQSRTGNYDLTTFFASGGMGEIPFCADFVGPVEIRQRSAGGWGLFATKGLKPGDLLLVSNPLAVIREKIGLEGRNPLDAVNDLTLKLAEQIKRSKRQMAQLYTLGGYRELEMGFPSMELFRPESDWIPPGAENLELDIDLEKYKDIFNIAKKRRFQYKEMKGPNENHRIAYVTGLWVLPALAKHSCAPNTQHSLVGDTLFLRASGRIMEGVELTVAYCDALHADVVTRQEIFESWMFTCICDRCVFEESIQTQLSKFSEHFRQINAMNSETLPQMSKKLMENLSTLNKLAVATGEIEAVIQSFGRALSPRQQGWIRASFLTLYMSKVLQNLALTENDSGCDSQFRIASLEVLIDSISSVYLNPKFLLYAAMLLTEANASYSKASQPYNTTLNRLLGICRVLFGNQPDTVLLNHIKACIPPPLVTVWGSFG